MKSTILEYHSQGLTKLSSCWRPTSGAVGAAESDFAFILHVLTVAPLLILSAR